MRRLISTTVPIAMVVVTLAWQTRVPTAQQQPPAAPSDVKVLWQFEAGG